MIPPPMRAQGVALYFLVLNLLSGTLGPTSVAVFSDHVFGPANVRYSLVVVAAVGSSVTLLLLAAGLGAYRSTLEYRERWIREH